MGTIIKTFENFKDRLYVTCKNATEDNYELHNFKNYEVVKYDNQPFGVGRVTILLPNGSEKTYPKTMFSKPFRRETRLLENIDSNQSEKNGSIKTIGMIRSYLSNRNTE
jgi:hypothetical protein